MKETRPQADPRADSVQVVKRATSVIEQRRIAVLGLENQAGVQERELNYLTDVLRRVASGLPSERYLVMTKDNILVMLPPNTKLEDCLGSCAVETGRKMGAHWILVGSVVRFGKSLRVTLNLHDTRSGGLRDAKQLKGQTVESLERPLEDAARSLFSKLEGGEG